MTPKAGQRWIFNGGYLDARADNIDTLLIETQQDVSTGVILQILRSSGISRWKIGDVFPNIAYALKCWYYLEGQDVPERK